MRLKRLSAAVLLVFFLFSLTAQAVLPVGFLIGELLIGTLGRAMFTSASVLGAAVAWIDFPPSTDAGTSSATSAQPITVQLNPNSPLTSDVPAGWASPTGSQIQPQAPNPLPGGVTMSFPAGGNFSCGATGSYSTANAEAANNAACRTATDTTYTWTAPVGSWDGVAGHLTLMFATQTQRSTGTIVGTNVQFDSANGPSVACPAGYTVSGTACNISNQALVQKPSDGKCAILRSGNTFSGDPQDPDCSTGSLAGAGVIVSGANITVGSAPNKVVTVKANSDGTTTINNYTTNTSNNTTTNNSTIVSAPSGSPGSPGGTNIIGTNQSAATGTGTAQTPIAPSATPLDISNLVTHADVGAVGTAVTALGGKVDVTNTKLDTLNTNLDPTAAAAALPGQQAGQIASLSAIFTNLTTAVTSAPADAAAAVSGFLDWSFVMPSCGCSPLSIDYKGHHAEFDWCPYFATVSNGLGYVFYLLTGIGLLALLTRRI